MGRRPLLDREQLLMLGSLAAVTCLVGGLVVLRLVATGQPAYRFLGWNTFLAWLPVAFALMWARATEDGDRRIVRLAWAGAWLLFLPNAPYLLTDMQHFNRDGAAPRWYDSWLFGANALNGLLLGSAALAIGHRALDRSLGTARAWCMVVLACLLSGFGIYLGRFIRLNSWDVVADPTSVVRAVALMPLSDPRAAFVTLVAGGVQLCCYLTLRGAASLQRAAVLADYRASRE